MGPGSRAQGTPMARERQDAMASTDDDALLAGACELAMLEDAWQHFVKRPDVRYLFVIDAPRITSIHALPPQNIAQFGITGLLSSPDRPTDLHGTSFEARQRHYLEQARTWPLTVGMTEILARYLFTDRWSAGAPKLIMASQWEAINRILDTVEAQSIEELRRSLDSAIRNGALDRLREHVARSGSPERLLDEVLERLPELMPAVYGAYTATRQLFRYMEVLPLEGNDSNAAVFAEGYADIHEILASAQASDLSDPHSLRSLELRWQHCIPPRQDRSVLSSRFPALVRPGAAVQQENARTFAEIEFVNRQLKARGLPHRLAFVTTTGRLFTAAHKRFMPDGTALEFIELQHEGEGTRDSYRKFRYYARLLEQGDDEMGLLPLVDPRMLMTSPDFVRFANYQQGNAADYSSRAISAWIPLFFEFLRSDTGAGLDIQRLFDLYRRLVVKSPVHPRTDTPGLLTIARGMDLAALEKSWNDYVSLVSAAEATGRLVKADSELRDALLSANSGPQQLRDVVNRRLDETMSQWLSALGRATIDCALRHQVDAPAGRCSHAHFERMPALLVPLLVGCPLSQDQLAGLFERSATERAALAALTEAIEACTAWHESDLLRGVKSRYVQILGQAYVFGMLGNWDSVQRLTMQAFALAENFLAEEPDQPEETYISGREAAFLAAVSRRRLPLTWTSLDTQEDEARAWLAKYSAAFALETEQHGLVHVQKQLLHERSKVEGLAWQLLRWLHYLHQKEVNEEAVRGTQPARADELAALSHALLRECEDLLPELESAGLSESVRQSYRSVALALCCDLALMGLQVHVLAPMMSRSSKDRLQRYLQVLEAAADRRTAAGGDGIAVLEQETIRAARHQLGNGNGSGNGSTATAPREPAAALDGFDRWRIEVLQRRAGGLPAA